MPVNPRTAIIPPIVSAALLPFAALAANPPDTDILVSSTDIETTTPTSKFHYEGLNAAIDLQQDTISLGAEFCKYTHSLCLGLGAGLDLENDRPLVFIEGDIPVDINKYIDTQNTRYTDTYNLRAYGRAEFIQGNQNDYTFADDDGEVRISAGLSAQPKNIGAFIGLGLSSEEGIGIHAGLNYIFGDHPHYEL